MSEWRATGGRPPRDRPGVRRLGRLFALRAAGGGPPRDRRGLGGRGGLSAPGAAGVTAAAGCVLGGGGGRRLPRGGGGGGGAVPGAPRPVGEPFPAGGGRPRLANRRCARAG